MFNFPPFSLLRRLETIHWVEICIFISVLLVVLLVAYYLNLFSGEK